MNNLNIKVVGAAFFCFGMSFFAILGSIILASHMASNVVGITMIGQLFSTQLTGVMFWFGVFVALIGAAILYFGDLEREPRWV